MELLNCPFCGDKPIMLGDDAMHCRSCNIDIHRMIWNTRAPGPLSEKVIEAAIEYRDNEYSAEGHHPDESCCALCDLIVAVSRYQKAKG